MSFTFIKHGIQICAVMFCIGLKDEYGDIGTGGHKTKLKGRFFSMNSIDLHQ